MPRPCRLRISAAAVLFPEAELPRRTISFVPEDPAGTVLTLAARVPECVYRHTQSLARAGWPGPHGVVSPAVEGECGPVLDSADDSGGVLDRVRRQAPRVSPQELGASVRLADGGLAVPVAGFEREPDAGVGACGVALVDGQGQAHGGGVERDAGFLFGLPDGGIEDVLAFFAVAAWGSA